MSGGVPDYRHRRNKLGHTGWWARRRCRRRGGHWEGQGYVHYSGYTFHRVDLRRVCSACGADLGPIKANVAPPARLDELEV